ncbi:MAG: GNAT family N-acetyltransferase [Verrucomicrobia bacterium]|nr:GNAT family N-acetyltransferase [Verrucomicrobiota bacterium]
MQPISTAAATGPDCAECAILFVEQLREHGIQASGELLCQVLEEVVTDDRHGFVHLARAEGRIVGVAYVATILSMEHLGPAAWLEELYVTPAWRRRGVGSTLVAAVLERARAADMVAVDLEIDVRHNHAASLYERSGFHRLERSRWARKLPK